MAVSWSGFRADTKEEILSTPIGELYNVDAERKDKIFKIFYEKAFSDFNWLLVDGDREGCSTFLKQLWDIGDEASGVTRYFDKKRKKKKKFKSKARKKMKNLRMFFEEALSIVTDSDLLLQECVQDDVRSRSALDLIQAVNEVIGEISFSLTENTALNMVTVIDFIRTVSNCPLVEAFSPETYVTLAAKSGADVNMKDYNTFTSAHPISECCHIEDTKDRESTIEALLVSGADMFQYGKAHSLNQSLFPTVIHHFTELETGDAISALKLYQRFHPQPSKFFTKKFPNGSTWVQNFLRCVWCKYCGLKLTSRDVCAIRDKLKFLAAEKVNFKRGGKWDEPPVIIAANGFDGRVMLDFLEVCAIRAPMTAKGWFGRTALHVSSDMEVIRKLCSKYKADVNAVDIFGRTPLMYAVSSIDCRCERPSKFESMAEMEKCCDCVEKSVDRIRVLMELGADSTLADQDGVTALHLGAAAHHPRVLEILLRNCTMQDVSSMLDNTGSSLLHYSVFANSIQCTKLLLNYGLDCNVHDQNRKTPLNIAILNGFRELSKLLRSGTMLNKKARLSCNPFPVKSSVKVKVIHRSDGDDRKDEVLRKIIAVNQSMTEADYDAILNSPFLGCNQFDEAKDIKSEVESLVCKLSKSVTNLKPEFAFSVKLRGSSKEATKVGFPDEYDFNLIMKKIIDPTEMLYSSAEDYPEFDFSVADNTWFSNKESTDTHFSRAFIVTILRVLNSQNFWTNFKLKMGGLWMGKVGPLLTLYWNGATYKHLKISVDLVPSFPIEYIQPFIPMQFPIPVDFSGCELHQTLDKGGELNVSYSEMEAILLKHLPKSAIDGYKIAKAIRSVYISKVITSSGLTCEFIVDCIPSFLLKNLLLLEFNDAIATETDASSIERGNWVERIYKRLLKGGDMMAVCGEEFLHDRF